MKSARRRKPTIEALEPRQFLSTTQNLVGFVNPFVGTNPDPGAVGGIDFDTGDVFPGATTPFGMVQFSPDTGPTRIAGGYWYPNTTISSFSLDHFSGRGIPYLGDIGLMPITTGLSTSSNFAFTNYSSSFSHANESASPGDYKVALDSGPTVELTDTAHTGLMQVTFPSATSTGTLLINVSNSTNGVSAGQVNVVNGNEITGWAQTTIGGGPGGQYYKVYFSAVFDQPITSSGTWNGGNLTPGSPASSTASISTRIGAYVSFNTSTTKTINAALGISFVSIANARLNRTTESPGFNFATVKQAASNAWNAKLNSIQVDPGSTVQTDGNTAVDKTVFYTALYHTMIQPNIADDVNGQYLGFDNQVHTVASGHHQYTNISGWDEYRSDSPLLAFLFPNEMSDIAQSLLNDASQSNNGIPRWVQENQNSNTIDGDGGSIVVDNAYAFGATQFNTTTALNLLMNTASINSPIREDMADYINKGYLPDAGAGTLEDAVADEALAQFSKSIGRMDLYQTYMTRAQNWKNIFNPANLTITSRSGNGQFDDNSVGWIEGSQSQYTWLVPFNLPALFNLMGGNAAAISRLNNYFGYEHNPLSPSDLNAGPAATTDFTGNEPDESDAWSYDYAGQPWMTQQTVRRIQTGWYTNTPGGSPGNDDEGAMSSWYVFSALGLYPMISGLGGFVVGSPLFTSATVNLENGHTLQINATNAAHADPYVQSMQINGASNTSLWITAGSLMNSNNTLSFALGTTPNTAWGSKASDAPPSFDTPTTTMGTGQPVNLGSSFNLVGIVADGSSFSGGVDGNGNALSGTLLGSHQTWNNDTYNIGAVGTNNVISATGQNIALPSGTGSKLSFLALGVNGNQANQTFTVNYTDGTHDTFTQSISDWHHPQGYTGESNVLNMNYRDVYNGTEQASGGSPWFVYGYTLSLNSSKHVSSITLPNNANIKVLAMDLTPSAAHVTQANLSASFNLTGIVVDNTTFSGGLDNNGNALSAALLGTSQTWNGNSYAIGAAGSNNVISASGQGISLPPGNYSKLSFLATGVNGNQVNQTFIVNYSDGTHDTFTQSMSDWHHPQGYVGESNVISMNYRDVYNGTEQSAAGNPWFIFGYSFGVNSSKTVSSITLPNNANVKVLAIDLM